MYVFLLACSSATFDTSTQPARQHAVMEPSAMLTRPQPSFVHAQLPLSGVKITRLLAE